MVTVALGTTAPVGSVIVPVMTPCTVCDQTAAPLARISRAAATIVKVRSLILSPLSKAFSAEASETNLEFSFCKKPQNTTATLKHQNAGQTPLFVGQFNYLLEGMSRANLRCERYKL